MSSAILVLPVGVSAGGGWTVAAAVGAGVGSFAGQRFDSELAVASFLSGRTVVLECDSAEVSGDLRMLSEFARFRASTAVPLCTAADPLAGILLVGGPVHGRPLSDEQRVRLFEICTHFAKENPGSCSPAPSAAASVALPPGLVRKMAASLAHELGNAVAPLSVYQQLLSESRDDEVFRESLRVALSDAVRRISRFSNQMLFLGRERIEGSESVPLADLVEDAFHAAIALAPVYGARLDADRENLSLRLRGHPKALAHAFFEIALNALQASPSNPVLSVIAGRENGLARVAFSDPGAGFGAEIVGRATEPFFSTKEVGAGLGLTTARHILEALGGTLEITDRTRTSPTTVSLHVPLAAAAAPVVTFDSIPSRKLPEQS